MLKQPNFRYRYADYLKDIENVENVDPLYLDLDDDDFVGVIEDRIQDFYKFCKKKELGIRQQNNIDHVFGRQRSGDKIRTSEREYKENIIYESILRIKPIALSRLPDFTVKAGSDTVEARKSAEDLTKVLNNDVQSRENRKLLGLMHRLEPVYFYAVQKCVWNPEKGEDGDYEFINIHPNNFVFDHTCTTSDTDDMEFCGEYREMTVKQMIMSFPDKEKEIKDAVGLEDLVRGDDNKEKGLASKHGVWELWFNWYKRGSEESGKWEKISGVVWKYKNLILRKMKNPYFDFQGKPVLFDKEFKEKEAISEDEIYGLMSPDESENQFRVYNNYFTLPRKPYYLMVYENWGEHPINETTRVEQILDFQDWINDQGKQIGDMNRRSRGKNVFDTNAIDAETIETLDLYNIDEAIGINVLPGKSVRDAHTLLQQMPATQQMYKSMEEARSKGFELMGVNATTRGVRESGDDTLGGMQMMREADYGLIDDIVEETINDAAIWQAKWAMQMIRLFYTKPHMRRILGKDGDVLFQRVTQDIIDDGMEVIVSASGVDKLQRKRMAIQNMQSGVGDILTYYIDTEQSNPKERARKAFLYVNAPQMYYQEFLAAEMQPEQGQLGQPPAPPMAMPQAGAQAPPGTPPPQAM